MTVKRSFKKGFTVILKQNEICANYSQDLQIDFFARTKFFLETTRKEFLSVSLELFKDLFDCFLKHQVRL